MLTDEQKHFREIVRAFHTDCVLHPGGWGEELVPLWQYRVIRQRLEMLDNGGWNKATDAEVAIYLSAASGIAPFDRDWTEIFVYEVSLLMGDQVYQMLGEPNDGLTDYQKTEVEHLKHQIRDKQIKMDKGVTMQKNKILIEEREDGTLVGISRDGVDPYVKKVGLTWEQTISQLPFLKGMTDIAEEGWKVSPKNPSYAPPPKPEVKKTEPVKTTAKKIPAKKSSIEAHHGAKIEQPALSLDENPTASPATAEAIKPSESVVKEPEPVKAEEPKILAPIVSVAEATTNEPGQEKSGENQAKIDVTLHPSVTIPEVSPEIQIVSPAEQVSTLKVDQPKPTRTSADAFQYKLKDGRGPVATVQEAMDLLGLDKATRPTHNRYDRLSKKLQEEIIREAKA